MIARETKPDILAPYYCKLTVIAIEDGHSRGRLFDSV